MSESQDRQPIPDVAKITGLTRVRSKGNDRKWRVIAYFDVIICGILEVRGCALARTDYSVTIWPPRLNDADPRRSLEFLDDGLRRLVKKAALAAYVAFGGDDLPDGALRDAVPPMPAPPPQMRPLEHLAFATCRFSAEPFLTLHRLAAFQRTLSPCRAKPPCPPLSRPG